VVLGRPVFFVDDEPARRPGPGGAGGRGAPVGFRDVQFQYEPIAAALDYESRVTREQRCWWPTSAAAPRTSRSCASGPARRGRAERRDDILANHGVHKAGTDFDRHVELAAILPLLGYRALRPGQSPAKPPREVPSGVYFDLATWHLINTVYAPARWPNCAA
jgi:hypothetical chaperone protein